MVWPRPKGVGRCEIAEALVISAMIVVLDEGRDLGSKVSPDEVVFEQNAVLECLVPTFDLPCICG